MKAEQPVPEFRDARAEDLDAVARLWHRSASLPDVGPPNMPSLSDLRARVDQELEAGWRLIVGVRESEIVGFMALKVEESILDQLFVCPSQIGTGLGATLLRQATLEMPDGFSLHTASTNRRARIFYERAGLSRVREGPHPRSGHPVTYYNWASVGSTDSEPADRCSLE